MLNVPPITVDKTKDLECWYLYPEMLDNQRFKGFQNREDSSMLRGAFVVGQNVTFGSSGLPSLRRGYEVVGTEAADATPIKRAWLFENRSGDQFEMKVYDTKIYYMLVGVSSDWTLLKSGLTAGLDWDFANIGKSADATTHCVFSNGTDGFFRFNGANTTILSSTANTITKTGTANWDAQFYNAADKKLMINGTEYTYTGGEATTTLTGVTPDPTGEAIGSLAVQSPAVVSAMATQRGNVMMAHDGRLHVRQGTKKSLWDYSKLDDPFTFTTGSSDGDGGAKDIEFGGPITAFGKLNKTILCFKKRQIKMLDFIQFGSRLDSPRYQTLVSGDDRGTTLGAITNKATFATPLGMVFVTADKRLVLLTGITANNEPQYVFLSDTIQPIFTQGVFDSAVGICVDNVIYLSFRQDATSTSNDVVLRGDMTRQSIDTMGRVIPIRWDAPFIGWAVNDWTVIYNSTTGTNEIHWHSSLNSSTYRLIDQKSDSTTGYTGIIRSWAEHFDNPSIQKRMEECFIEIRMNENTQILATLLYDEDGFTGQKEVTLTGDNANYKFGGTAYNTFGATKYGSAKMGSNVNSDVPPVYRFNLEINPNIYFFNISLQLSIDGAGQDFELVRFGYKLSEIVKETDRKYLKE